MENEEKTYYCEDCCMTFTAIPDENGEVVCPFCGSTNVKEQE